MKKGVFILIVFSVISFKVTSQVLNVIEVEQEQDQWCWAGASACVLNYYCFTTPQCDIVEFTRTVADWHNFGEDPCCENPSEGCNYGNTLSGTEGSVSDILNHFGSISNFIVNSSLAKSAIQYDIDDNKVFIIGWEWNVGGGHALVGHGLINDDLYYMDPWFGEGYKISDYSWVTSGSGHTWIQSIRVANSYPSEIPLKPDTIIGNDTVCEGSYQFYYVTPLPYTDSYTWVLPGGWSLESTGDTIVCIVGNESGEILVNANNNCGYSYQEAKNITVLPQPQKPIISLNGNILHSDTEIGNQWYKTSGKIFGATDQDYTVVTNGNYFVIVSDSNCFSEMSNIVTVEGIGISEIEKKDEINIYPNPVNNELNIEFKGEEKNISVEILNISGKQMFKNTYEHPITITIKTKYFESGVYFVKLKSDKINENYRIVKE